MIIVSDTTPIISLIKADHLELFQEVLVPEAVTVHEYGTQYIE